MPSRRRSRSKNLNNNLSDVQRRLRSLERRPVRTKLASRVVTKAAIAPNSVSEDEVSFGTAVVVPPGEDINDVVGQIENPKDGLLVVDTDSGSSKLYSQEDDTYVDITDPIAQGTAEDAQQAADDAAADALAAQQAADDAAFDAAAALSAAGTASTAASNAQTSANGKNKVFRQTSVPTATAIGDIWFHENDPLGNIGTKGGDTPKRWNGTAWVTFGLNYLAVTSLDAGDIVTGTLEAITVRTSLSGERRIELNNQDDILFFKSSGQIGVITGINAGWDGGEDEGTYNINTGILIAAVSTSPTQGAPAYPSLAVSGTFTDPNSGDVSIPGAYVFGDSDTYLAAETGSVYTVGAGFTSYADIVLFNTSDAAGMYTEVAGPLVLSGTETVVASSTAPTAPPTSGQAWTMRFHYT
jgi:hypothetical protein